MRHILSTALVALIVGSLASITVGALAQSEPESDDISTAAVRVANSDKVDGRHAVGAAATKANRANKLVATNRYGMLPGNIVKPYWGMIRNKPAGFADGKDNVGIKRLYDRSQVFQVSEAAQMGRSVKCDTGDFATGGSAYVGDFQSSVTLTSDHPSDDGRGWTASTLREGSQEAWLTIWVVCAAMG